jgi:hypothetical protein
MSNKTDGHWHRISSCGGEFFFSTRDVKSPSLEFLALAGDFCARKQRGRYGNLDDVRTSQKHDFFSIIVILFGLVATEYRKYVYGWLPVRHREKVMHPEQGADSVL